MEQKEDKPKTTGGLSQTSPRKSGGLRGTSPLSGRDFLLEDIEYYAFIVVFALVIFAGFVVPQQMLDERQISILLFIVLPILAWFVRIIYKSYPH